MTRGKKCDNLCKDTQMKIIIALIITISIAIYEKPNLIFTTRASGQTPGIVNSSGVKTPSIPTPTVNPIKNGGKLQKTSYKGLASYYSRSGCLGCSKDFLMANGEPLDDTKLTVAFMRAPLGTIIEIINIKTQQSILAKVTDRGGFEHTKIPKIADLSVATKEAIGCGSVCDIEIKF